MDNRTYGPYGGKSVSERINNDDVENAENLKNLIQSFTDYTTECKDKLSQLPGTSQMDCYWTNFHQTSLRHHDIMKELNRELTRIITDRQTSEDTLSKENALIVLKEQEVAYLNHEVKRMKKTADIKKEDNGIRMWEITTRVSFLYQLNQALNVLTNYHQDVLKRRLKPRIEARNRAFDLLQNVLGNIRVFCRLRPTKDERIETIISKNALMIKSAARSNVTGTGMSNNEYRFDFFYVFGERDSQKIVYDEIKHLIMSAALSCNVTLFAYGQTGSGKTWTMEGLEGDEKHEGLRPRALKHVMELMKEWRCAGIELECSYSFFEIYNEIIRDLLDNGAIKDVKENGCGIFYIVDLMTKPIDINRNVNDISKEIHKVLAHRSTGATMANENSSRSHSVFQFRFIHGDGRQHTLSMIDLAGSERLAKTAATGKRAAEAKNINLSLSALNDTLTALGSAQGSSQAHQSHIPYRQSKLTQILKESLCSTNCKVVMFVNISTAKADLNESINSLRFATKVQGVKIKRPIL